MLFLDFVMKMNTIFFKEENMKKLLVVSFILIFTFSFTALCLAKSEKEEAPIEEAELTITPAPKSMSLLTVELMFFHLSCSRTKLKQSRGLRSF